MRLSRHVAVLQFIHGMADWQATFLLKSLASLLTAVYPGMIGHSMYDDLDNRSNIIKQ